MPIFSGLLGAAAMGQQGTNAGQMQAVELAQMLEQIRNRRAEMALQGILPQGATLEPGQAPRVPSSNPAPAPLPPPPPSMARRPDEMPPAPSATQAPAAPPAPSPSLEEALGAPPPNINLGPGMPRIEGAMTAAGQRRAALMEQIRVVQAEKAQKVKDLIAAGVPEAIAPAAVENPQLLEHLQGGPFAKPPVPHEPIMGSPEWLKAKEAEARITAKYRRPDKSTETDDEGLSIADHKEIQRRQLLLMKPTRDKFGKTTPGLSATEAYQQAHASVYASVHQGKLPPGEQPTPATGNIDLRAEKVKYDAAVQAIKALHLPPAEEQSRLATAQSRYTQRIKAQ